MNFHLRCKKLVLTAAALAVALPAMAQWQWVDKDGSKVFSDRAPPADIKDRDILKQPGVRMTPMPVAKAMALGASANATAASAPKAASSETELEAKKKQTEKDEALKKKAEEEKQAIAKQENCDRAKVALRTLQSGVRIASTNAAGEREVINDVKRAEETKRTVAVIDTSCKK